MDLQQRWRSAAVRWQNITADGLETAFDRLDQRSLPAWLVGTLLIAVPSHALAVWRVVGDLPAGTRPPLRDSLIFEYIGWYLVNGGRLYLDVWEIKPPLPYELTAVVSLIAGGDPWVAHWLNVLLTIAAAIGTAIVVGALVHDLTGDQTAAFAAAVSLYVLPAYHWRAAFGFKVKYFVPLLVLLGVYLARRDRPLVAGVMAGAAAGFWQLAILGPGLVMAVAGQRAGRRAAGRVLAGSITIGIVAVLPVVYWGALEAMVAETVLVPLVVSDHLTPVAPIPLAGRLIGGGLPVVILGGIGAAYGLYRRPRETWWIALGVGWFAAIAVLIDLDSAPDLFALIAFIGVGLGVLLGLEGGPQRGAAALVALIAVTSVVTMGGFGITGPALVQPDPVEYDSDRQLELPYGAADRPHLLWNGVRPDTCRVFYGPTQYRLVHTTSLTGLQETCGDAGPLIDTLLARWGG